MIIAVALLAIALLFSVAGFVIFNDNDILQLAFLNA